MRYTQHYILVCILELAACSVCAEDRRISTVGMPERIEQIVVPGSELEVRPIEDRQAPVVLRITNTFPHGTAFRYDLVYHGLEPGEFDLRDYLRRKDGSSLDDIPPILVEVQSLLPSGQVEPHRPDALPSPRLGGYRVVGVAAGILWVAGLCTILFARRRSRVDLVESASQPKSLADRLRPIVEAAMAGTISHGQQAELERLLLAFWRRRLKIDHLRPAEAMTALRENQESGPLLHQLESWLHQPGSRNSVDIALLLRPYQDLPADAIQ